MVSSIQMIDVGGKAATRRIAVARGAIHVGPRAFAMIESRALPKGDALLLAEIAGIQGAKNAAASILLCHPLPLDHVSLRHELDKEASAIIVFCKVSAFARTGVEMEAMAGVQAALLTIYDLTKMVETDLTLGDSFLLAKLGGKSGLYLSPRGVPDWLRQELGLDAPPPLRGVSAAVVTLSDRAAEGVYEDRSGPVLRRLLEEAGADVKAATIIPDEREIIAQTLDRIARDLSPQLIVTTGGTGVAPRDVTPEAIADLAPRLVPGLGEFLRQDGSRFTRHSWSSRSLAAVLGSTLIVALPGNPKAVREGFEALLPLLPHLLDTIAGKKHDSLRPS